MEQDRPLWGFSSNVLVAGLVSLLMDISSEMIYPLVPLFLSTVLGVNVTVIGLIEGVAEAAASLLKGVSGRLSDHLGRRKGLMLAGYAISSLSRPLMATAVLWQQVLAARLIDRLGKGVRTAPRDAIIAESTAPTHLGRAFSLHRAMDTAGAVLGPGLAIWLLSRLGNNAYQTVFWLATLPALGAVVVVAVGISEPRPGQQRPAPSGGRPAWAAFSWRTKLFIAIAALFAFGNSSDAFLILRARQAGVGAVAIPAVYLVFNLVYSLSAFPAGWAADRLGKRRVILLGFLLFAGLYWGFARVSSRGGLWGLFALYGLFMGLTEGVQKAFLAAITTPSGKATAFGVYATATGLATLPASLIGGWLWEHVSPAATFYFGAGTASLAALLFATFMFDDLAKR